MLLYFWFIYIIFQFIILNILYFKIKVYYTPLYEAFQAKDELIYWKIILFGMIFFPIKFISLLTILMSFIIYQNIFYFFNRNFTKDENEFYKYAKSIKFFTWIFYKVSMINLKEKKIYIYIHVVLLQRKK